MLRFIEYGRTGCKHMPEPRLPPASPPSLRNPCPVDEGWWGAGGGGKESGAVGVGKWVEGGRACGTPPDQGMLDAVAVPRSLSFTCLESVSGW